MKEPGIVPSNDVGASSETTHEVTSDNATAAGELHRLAKQRLLDVNRWHEISGTGSAVFQLVDENGKEVYRPAQLGDLFRIDIPGPGTAAGGGYDWVQVEAIEDTVADEKEELAMRVRPAADPSGNKEDVAHFFTEEASSTFSVTRSGNTIIAAVHGRNEKPNSGAEKVIDKLRNTVVATGAILGLNKPQWKSLVKGILG